LIQLDIYTRDILRSDVDAGAGSEECALQTEDEARILESVEQLRQYEQDLSKTDEQLQIVEQHLISLMALAGCSAESAAVGGHSVDSDNLATVMNNVNLSSSSILV
jgi:hypothetical protein